MDAAAAQTSGAPACLGEERLSALGNFICRSDRPLLAVTRLRRDGGALAFESRVAGGSMGTSIPNGARIRVVDSSLQERGQIIAFVAGGKTLVHRVRWRGHAWAARGWMITQGDTLRLPDPPVHRNAVLGHVEAVEHGPTWESPAARERLPRRDRALSLLILTACVGLLEIHPRIARWMIERLRAAEARRGWTRALLYRPATPSPPRASLIFVAAVAACRLGALVFSAIRGSNPTLMSLWDSGQRLLGAICNEALSREEKGRLTVRIYDFFPGYHRTFDRLHAWEGPWFERRLPPPPARVLVGGAGVGREAVRLAAQGLEVDAFDPAPDLVVACRRALGERSKVDVLSYEAFSAIVLDRADPAQRLHTEHYNAIVLGSGSLAHVLDPSEHERLLRSCATLCPTGPILMSFYCDGDSTAAPPPGRAVRIGRRIGRALADLRGTPGAGSDQLSYRPHGGFAYTFTCPEVERLSSTIYRKVSWEPGTTGAFRCVTLLPPAKPTPSL